MTRPNARTHWHLPAHPVCVRMLLSRFRPGARDLQKAALYLAAGLVLIALTLALVVQLPQSPYNVRELFADHHLALSLPLFAAWLVWCAGVPNLLARVTIICPLLHLAQPLLFLVLAVPSWWLLRLSVSAESLLDVLGEPVLGWPGDWELFVRYLALSAPLLLSLFYWNLLMEGSAWLSRAFGVGQMLGALLLGLPLLWLSKYLVVDRAATRQVLELSAQGPSWYIGGALALAMATVTLNGVLLAWATLWGGAYRLAVLALTPALLGLSWWLLGEGLRPDALPFLLGPGPGAQGTDLFPRWALVYGAAVALIAFAHLIPFRLRGTAAAQRRALSAGALRRHRGAAQDLPMSHGRPTA